MIFQEEQIFRKTLAQASGIKYPELPVDETPEAMEKYNKQKATYEKKLQKRARRMASKKAKRSMK